MFTQEVAAVRKLDELAFRLTRISGDMCDAAETLDVPVLCKHLDAVFTHLDSDSLNKPSSTEFNNEVDQVVLWMVEGERSLAKNLPKFDKLLNAIIAERLKLGDFTISHTA